MMSVLRWQTFFFFAVSCLANTSGQKMERRASELFKAWGAVGENLCTTYDGRGMYCCR